MGSFDCGGTYQVRSIMARAVAMGGEEIQSDGSGGEAKGGSRQYLEMYIFVPWQVPYGTKMYQGMYRRSERY